MFAPNAEGQWFKLWSGLKIIAPVAFLDNIQHLTARAEQVSPVTVSV